MGRHATWSMENQRRKEFFDAVIFSSGFYLLEYLQGGDAIMPKKKA